MYKLKIYPILVHNPISANPVTWVYGLIRLWTRSFYNHAVVRVITIYESGTEKVTIDEIYDANLRGVISRPYDVWATANNRKCLALEVDGEPLKVLKKLKRNLGKLYDFRIYLSRVFGVKIKENRSIYCFELLEKIYGKGKNTDGKYWEQYATGSFETFKS